MLRIAYKIDSEGIVVSCIKRLQRINNDKGRPYDLLRRSVLQLVRIVDEVAKKSSVSFGRNNSSPLFNKSP